MLKAQGVRRSVTVWAALALAIALLVGALILRNQLRIGLEQGIADETASLAESTANLVANGAYLPTLIGPDRPPAWIQVVDERGVVVARTPNVAKLTRPFAPIPAGNIPAVRRMQGLPIDTGERVVVATVPVITATQRLVVMVGSPLDLAEAADAQVVRLLGMVFPALILIASLIVWTTTKRAMRPIKGITAEMASITTTDLSRRVPVPASDDEVSYLATTINTTLDRLEGSVSRQRRFVADASHELRSPLASLRNQLEASVYDNQDPTWASTVADMQIDHARLERLVLDLLLLARRDEGKREVREPTDFGYLVRSEMNRRPTIEGQDRIVLAENVLVDANSDAVIRILRNLVDNAERHTSTYVRVTVQAKIDIATIIVEDDGPGIAEQNRAHVFERFYRVDAARSSDSGGSGLGLAIVAELIADLDGTITLSQTNTDDDAHPGARFELTFPVLHLSE